MTKVKLKNHPGCQCHVEKYDNGTIVFVSYKTPIAKIEKGMLCPIQNGKYWDDERIYTPTTARQISYFLREYAPSISYQQFKKAALNDKDLEV